jgi:hypothetical protein
MPVCGSWEFESNQVEGWARANPTTANNAWDGDISVSTARSLVGTHSLVLPVDDKGGYKASGKYLVEITIPVCPGGQGIALSGAGALRFSSYLEPAPGSPPIGYSDGWFSQYNGGTIGGGAGDWINTVNQWEYHTLDSTSTITDLKLTFRIESTAGWKGKIYIDSIYIH